MYSTNEHIVGTDVDGSAIYEKTYYSDNAKLSGAYTVIDSNLKPSILKRVISINGSYYVGDGSEGWMPDIRLSESATVAYDCYTRCGSLGLLLIHNNRTISKYHVTIRYVKA